MAAEAEPSDQLTVQDTGNVCESEIPAEPALTTDKPPAKKPVISETCALCNVTLTSQSIVDAHMASKKHKRKLQAAESMKNPDAQKKVPAADSPLYRCDICKVTLNSSQQKEFHLAGMKHTNRVKKNAEANEMFQETSFPHPSMRMDEPAASFGGPPAAGAGGMISETMPLQEADLRCDVCKITVNSAQQLTQHLSSKKHQFKENSLKRSAPYFRPQGRGGPGSMGGRGRGRGGRGGRSNAEAVNSLQSNFQSAGFTSNFQTHGRNQSLKRDRSPRSASFGNGNNDDFMHQSYQQGGKIPRGSQSTPFNSHDSMDNSFTSGTNAFGGGNNSFGGGKSSFRGKSNSFRGGNKSFGGGNKSFGGGNKPFGRGNKSFGGGNSSFGGGNSSFGAGNSTFGGGNSSFGGDSSSFGGDSSSFGGDSSSFGGGNTFGRGKNTFGGGNNSFGAGKNSFGGGNNSYGGGKNAYGGGSSSFGGGNSSFGGGNSSFGGEKSFGNGNNSYGGDDTSFGAKGTFDSGNSFGDSTNSFHAGFGRGKMRGGSRGGSRGGPRGGSNPKRGRGFGHPALESGY